MKPRKVFFLTNGESYFVSTRLELAERLLSDGIEVYLSCPKGSYYDKLIGLGIKRIETLIERHGNDPIKDFLLFLSYVRNIHRIKPDYVLTYTIKPNLYGSLASRLCRCPCISNITGIGEVFQKKTLLGSFLSWGLKIATSKNKCMFFQNQDNMIFYNNLGIHCSNQHLLPGSGVDLQKHPFIPLSDDSKSCVRFLMLGRICRSKGVLEYLDAAKRILNKFQNTECYLVGPNDDSIFYEQVLTLVPQTPRFHLIPEIDFMESARLVSQIHCLVHPSYHEGMSNVILEAAATGRAAIASNIPGCREIIDDGITGFLVKPKNPDSLFDAMVSYCNLSFEDKKTMGIKARKKVEVEFDRQIVIQKYIEMMY